MRQKIKLKQADNFDSWVAAREMSGMLVKYLDGQPHAKSIGNEQGIKGWDDFVIEEYDESYTCVQVKRQETDFSEHSENRRISLFTKGQKKGQEHDLSAFDEAIRDLGKLYSTPNTITGKEKKFRLEIPAAQTTRIKKDIELRHFYSLCERCRNETTTAAKLKENADVADEKMFDWLTTWCEFQDWGHILRTLKTLSLSYTPLESGLKNAIDHELGAWFNPAADARQAIYHYIQDNSTDTGAATPRLILRKLAGFLRPDKSRWLYYSPTTNPLNWQVAGTIDHHSERELPTETVPFLWNTQSGLARRLLIGGNLPAGNLTRLQLALLRLVLHLPSPAQVFVSNAEAYKAKANCAIAGTLGSDIGDIFVSIANDDSTINPSDTHPLNGVSETNNESQNLHNEMDVVTWKLVQAKVGEQISAMSSAGDLQQNVSELWQTWHGLIENNTMPFGKLMLDMLSVRSEGDHVQSLLRVGPETVDLMAECLLLHLVISVALDGNDAQYDKLKDGLTIRTLALSYWGGPAGSARGSRQFITDDSNDEVATLVGQEPHSILIFSGVATPPSEIFPESLADDLQAKDSLAAPRRPDLMITNCRTFKQLRAKNMIEPIKMHLKDELEKVRESREKNIQGIRK